jgi:hypothetical protein
LLEGKKKLQQKIAWTWQFHVNNTQIKLEKASYVSVIYPNRFRKIIAVYSENHTKCMNALREPTS